MIVFQPQRIVGSHTRAASPAPSLGAAARPTGLPSNEIGSGAASYAHIAAAAAAAAATAGSAAAGAAAGPGPHQGPPHLGPPQQGPPHQGPQAPSQQQQQQQLAHQHMQAGLLPDQQQTSAAVQQPPTSQQQQQQDLQTALQQLAQQQQQQQQQQASRPAAYATGIASFPPTLPPSSALLSTHHASHPGAASNTVHTAPGSALPIAPLNGVLQQQQQAGPVGQAPGWPSQNMGGRQYIAEVEQTRQMSASVPAASHVGMHFESCNILSALLQHGSGDCDEAVQDLFDSTG